MTRSILSLKKAADILGLFIDGAGGEQRLYGLTDFSRALGLPKPTVQSLVRTLEEIGYLEKDPETAKYRLGPVLFQLGMKYATNMDLATVARSWMERLCAQFSEAAHVGMLVGGKVIIALRVEPESTFMVFPHTGSVIPFHTSAIGKVLFAHMETKKRDGILSSYEFIRLTEYSIADAQRFVKELEKARKAGVAFDNQESVVGLSCVGGPIFNARGKCIAAFSLSGNAHTIERRRDEIVNAVKYVSHQISSQMGYRRGA